MPLSCHCVKFNLQGGLQVKAISEGSCCQSELHVGDCIVAVNSENITELEYSEQLNKLHNSSAQEVTLSLGYCPKSGIYRNLDT